MPWIVPLTKVVLHCIASYIRANMKYENNRFREENYLKSFDFNPDHAGDGEQGRMDTAADGTATGSLFGN